MQFGLWSADSALLEQIESLRDQGTRVRLWGEILSGVPDVNGSQVQVSRMEVLE